MSVCVSVCMCVFACVCVCTCAWVFVDVQVHTLTSLVCVCRRCFARVCARVCLCVWVWVSTFKYKHSLRSRVCVCVCRRSGTHTHFARVCVAMIELSVYVCAIIFLLLLAVRSKQEPHKKELPVRRTITIQRSFALKNNWRSTRSLVTNKRADKREVDYEIAKELGRGDESARVEREHESPKEHKSAKEHESENLAKVQKLAKNYESAKTHESAKLLELPIIRSNMRTPTRSNVRHSVQIIRHVDKEDCVDTRVRVIGGSFDDSSLSPILSGLRAPPPSPVSATDEARRESYVKLQVTDGEVMLERNETKFCLIFVHGIEYHYVVCGSEAPSWDLPEEFIKADWFLKFPKSKQKKFNLHTPPMPLTKHIHLQHTEVYPIYY